MLISYIEKHSSYQTALQYLWPLQSHCDAVEKDEGQDHVVKELMSDNGLAEQSEPEKRETEGAEGREGCEDGVRFVQKDKIPENAWFSV